MTERKQTTKTTAKKTTAKPAAKKAAGRPAAKAKTKTKPEAVSDQPPVTRLRIRVRAYEYKVLDLSVQQIIDNALRYDVEVRGPVPLPTEIKKYTVNRSSFIYSKSREQFEMRIHKRLIDILNPSQKVIESLTNINLPSGVSVDVKMV